MNKEKYNFSRLTITLIVINIAIYLYTMLLSKSENISIMVLLNHGGLYRDLVLEGEYYRLLISNFLHGNFLHLFFNMYCLFSIGPIFEKLLGKFRYLLLYLICGLSGSFLSFLLIKENTVSVGASSSIFGLFGALIVFTLMRKDLFQLGASKNIIIMVLINLFYGFFSQGSMKIDNFGHIGGLVMGAIIAFIIVNLNKYKKRG